MTPEERHAALLEYESLRQEYARRKLLAFAAYINPNYAPNWHHKVVADELDLVLAGQTKRLMLFMPPQHGKTELASRNLVALALGKNPDLQVIFGTYNAERAKEVSGHVQDIMSTPEYRTLFPATRLASTKDEEVKNALNFEIVGRRGRYTAAGVGQGITGKSMMLGIIDDPIKGRKEAESDAERKHVKDWYRSDFATRQKSDKAAIVVIQTRWHADDLAGWLLQQQADYPDIQPWRVISFPAILEQERADDPRKLGEALWPSQFGLPALREIRSGGIYDWSALYQQTPVPPGGVMAKREWFKIIDGRKAGAVRKCRAWDLAGTEAKAGRDPDWTVGTLLAQYSDGTWVVEHVVRLRSTPNDVDRVMLQTAQMDGRQVLIREERVGLAGKVIEASHLKLLAGYDYAAVSIGGQGGKTMRWRPFLSQAEGGNVSLVKGDWNQAWLDELSMVPYGTLHDDQADSVGLGFNEILNVKDYGSSIAVVMPGTQTVSGPRIGAWQEHFFRR